MAQYRITRDEAFNLLRMASQRMHRKLADIAVRRRRHGALPAEASSRSRPA